jgi:hypothetical protein
MELFLISLWINPFSFADDPYLIQLGRNPNNYNNEMILQLYSSGQVHFYEYGNGYGISLTSTSTIAKGFTSLFFF